MPFAPFYRSIFNFYLPFSTLYHLIQQSSATSFASLTVLDTKVIDLLHFPVLISAPPLPLGYIPF